MDRETAIAWKILVAAGAVTAAVLSTFGMQAWPILALTLLCVILAAMVGLTLRMRREIETRYRRTEALLALYAVVEPHKPLPVPRAYAGSPELLRAVSAAVFDTQPRTVLELGSGVTTLVAAYALAKLGSGRIVSLDHELQFAEATNQLLRAHKLDHVAKAIHAPLIEQTAGNRRGRWYDTSALAREQVTSIDVLIVDGPPGKDQPLARYPALPALAALLSERALILVDDAARRDETEMVRRWAAEFPGFEVDAVPTEKGLTYLKRSGPRPGASAPGKVAVAGATLEKSS
jgi:predicted O-methyltransferase YrrM